MKFKVGQTIQFTKDCSGYYDIEGLKGQIMHIDYKGMYIDVYHPFRFKKISFVNYDGIFVNGYSFLSDVFDSIKIVKNNWWRFWK